MSLAWDGTNLYVSDATTAASRCIRSARTRFPYAGVRNAASFDILARGRVTITGGIQAGDAIDINIGGTSSTDSAGKATITGGADYKYTVVAADTISYDCDDAGTQINAANSGSGDTNVYATPDLADRGRAADFRESRARDGNDADLVRDRDPGQRPDHGGQLWRLGERRAPFPAAAMRPRLRRARSFRLSATISRHSTASADCNHKHAADQAWRHAGLLQRHSGAADDAYRRRKMNAQIPWELGDTTSINAFVRSEMADGSVMVTTPVAVTIVVANPGIYAQPDTTLRSGLVYHASSSATGIVSVDGTATADDTASVTHRRPAPIPIRCRAATRWTAFVMRWSR